MESSRGGPLSTFIMMLPLIVVPAIAMLRPVGQEGSMLSGLLSAASSGDDAHSAEEIAEAVFAEIPAEEASAFEPSFSNSGPADDEFELLDAELFAEASNFGGGSDISAPTQPPVGNTASPFAPQPGNETVERLLISLQQMGSTNSLWFDPGDGYFGFVAFFKAGNGIMTYRFEAIARSKAEAIQDVVMQAKAWQQPAN